MSASEKKQRLPPVEGIVLPEAPSLQWWTAQIKAYPRDVATAWEHERYARIISRINYDNAPSDRDEDAVVTAATPVMTSTETPIGAERLQAFARASRALRRSEHVFGLISLLLPRRMRDEEIGDALELMHLLGMKGAPAWMIHLKLATTVFWLALNAARETIAGIRGTRSKS